MIFTRYLCFCTYTNFASVFVMSIRAPLTITPQIPSRPDQQNTGWTTERFTYRERDHSLLTCSWFTPNKRGGPRYLPRIVVPLTSRGLAHQVKPADPLSQVKNHDDLHDPWSFTQSVNWTARSKKPVSSGQAQPTWRVVVPSTIHQWPPGCPSSVF